MAQPRLGAASTLAVSAFALVLLEPRAGVAQTYEVSAEETGALPTVYTKRFNWRYYLTVYRHTTMIPTPNTNLCSESPCLDDNLPGGGLPPDGTRGGTASAQVSGMSAGTYRLEIRYNQTINRATSVPWKITTDAASNSSRSGNLDQKNTTPGAGNWLVLGQTGQNPIHVESSASFAFGSDTIMFNGSLSYGGIRLVRLGPLPTPSDGGVDGGPSDAAADATGDAPEDGSEDAAEDSSGDAVPDVFVPSDDAFSDAESPLDGSAGSAGMQSGVIPIDDSGCACRAGQAQAERGVLALLGAISSALAALRRRTRRNRRSGQRVSSDAFPRN
ncbi:MAG: hypothetical protein IPM35_28760 [Myxococcales bacterium]|nr:hypothetical protein [Myxococcales bacterium]